MLSAYVAGAGGLTRLADGAALPGEGLWLDLCAPTAVETVTVEQAFNIRLPTREEMREIEASNRFYEEDGSIYLTVTLPTKLDTELPQSTQVTFILSGGRLITNRYTELAPFSRFVSFAHTQPTACGSAPLLLAGILESIVNGIADVLERVGSDVESISARIFAPPSRRAARHDFNRELERIGQSGEFVSKARESLVSLNRLLGFLRQTAGESISPDARPGLRLVARDVVALSDHASFLGDKVQFLLDATLGVVAIEQNNIMKIFSVLTVLLLPPSVIGAFYGMNFEHIPWLTAEWGMYAALAMMVVSAVLPYLYFRRKGWL